MMRQLAALHIVSMLTAVMETLAKLEESLKIIAQYQKKRSNTYEKE